MEAVVGKKVLFCCRKVIIDHVKSLIAGGMSEDMAVKCVEGIRQENRSSLAKLRSAQGRQSCVAPFALLPSLRVNNIRLI